MSQLKLPDSEIKVMDFLWEQGETTAKEAALNMGAKYGWKKNTTYAVLKNLQDKGAVKRMEPGFRCVPLIEREQVGRAEAKTLLDRFYKGSASVMFSSFLDDKLISEKELAEIRALLERE